MEAFIEIRIVNGDMIVLPDPIHILEENVVIQRIKLGENNKLYKTLFLRLHRTKNVRLCFFSYNEIPYKFDEYENTFLKFARMIHLSEKEEMKILEHCLWRKCLQKNQS